MAAMLVYQDNPVGIELFSGFYLGYLRGRSFPPKMPSFPPKILSSIQYISNYIEKNHQDATRLVHTLYYFSKLCLKMHQIAS